MLRNYAFLKPPSQGTWKCIGIESGTRFTEVELEEGEWVDYDEKVSSCYNLTASISADVFQAALPAGVSNIESQWSRA